MWLAANARLFLHLVTLTSQRGSPGSFRCQPTQGPRTCDEDKRREAGEGRDINNQAVQGPREGQNAVDPVAEASGALQLMQHQAGAEDELPLSRLRPGGWGHRWRSAGAGARAAGEGPALSGQLTDRPGGG